MSAFFFFYQTLEHTWQAAIICYEGTGNRKTWHMWLEQSKPCREGGDMFAEQMRSKQIGFFVGHRKGFRQTHFLSLTTPPCSRANQIFSSFRLQLIPTLSSGPHICPFSFFISEQGSSVSYSMQCNTLCSSALELSTAVIISLFV